jgi:hypothetical protein
MQRILSSPIVTLRAGTAAQQGQILIKFLRDFDQSFAPIRAQRPDDPRLLVKGVVLVHELVQRYVGELSDERTEQLVNDFMGLGEEFVDSLASTWGVRVDDDMAWLQKLGDKLGIGEEQVLQNFGLALSGTPFIDLLDWLEQLLASSRKPTELLMPLLAASGNGYSEARVEGASTILVERARAGGDVKAVNSANVRDAALAQYDQWQDEDESKPISGLLDHLATKPVSIKVDENKLSLWLRERAELRERIAAETDPTLPIARWTHKAAASSERPESPAENGA